MPVIISGVEAGSPAQRRGIQPGERLLSINGHPVEDVLDYRFYLTESRLMLSLESDTGTRTIKIRKREYEDIGLQFDTYLMDRQRACRNKCVFCFIDQLPPGMRESLYFKDDDSRLSFLFGNYITLTNLTEREISRIIEMHISPIHISVHTTNPALRCQMMGNRFAGDCLDILHRFAAAGIRMECQLVLCPGYNDGEELRRSLSDLEKLMPAMESVACVPVGLTRYREGLTPLRMFTGEEAAAVIEVCEFFGDRLAADTGNRLVYPADEFYIKAGRPIPAAAFYGEFSQLENGVGLCALLRTEFVEALEQEPVSPAGSRLLIATGVAAAPLLRELVGMARKKWPQLQAEVVPVRNRFFGETIDVAGLVTGGDLISQLRGRFCDRILFPDAMLRHEGDRFLDDITLDEAERELGVPLQPVPASDGQALLQALLQ
ncbi:MAG: DUF512 domain-containing protein [Clostridiales bacterium]|nr:DUF512 domain-containing protein [Clostridiales bacterium]